jgi:hypothetical protein
MYPNTSKYRCCFTPCFSCLGGPGRFDGVTHKAAIQVWPNIHSRLPACYWFLPHISFRACGAHTLAPKLLFCALQDKVTFLNTRINIQPAAFCHANLTWFGSTTSSPSRAAQPRRLLPVVCTTRPSLSSKVMKSDKYMLGYKTPGVYICILFFFLTAEWIISCAWLIHLLCWIDIAYWFRIWTLLEGWWACRHWYAGRYMCVHFGAWFYLYSGIDSLSSFRRIGIPCNGITWYRCQEDNLLASLSLYLQWFVTGYNIVLLWTPNIYVLVLFLRKSSFK